jgi:uncharacterized protein (DUF1499 family)
MPAPAGAAPAFRRPVRLVAASVLVLALLAAAPFAALLAYGRDAFWADRFGPPDQGPYDFASPTRTGYPNDALACPAGACDAAAPERATPVFLAEPAEVLAAARALVEAMPGAAFAEMDEDRGHFRAVVRTPLMRFPDTLSLQVGQDAPGRTLLWLYSRSQIGKGDMGANRNRLDRLIENLAQALPAEPPPG